jgi:hypothetical protein
MITNVIILDSSAGRSVVPVLSTIQLDEEGGVNVVVEEVWSLDQP